MEMTRIELTPEEARIFIAFRQNQDFLAAILASGLPDIRNGQAVLHFGPHGLMRIEVNRLTYLNKKNLT